MKLTSRPVRRAACRLSLTSQKRTFEKTLVHNVNCYLWISKCPGFEGCNLGSDL